MAAPRLQHRAGRKSESGQHAFEWPWVAANAGGGVAIPLVVLQRRAMPGLASAPRMRPSNVCEVRDSRIPPAAVRGGVGRRDGFDVGTLTIWNELT